VASGFPKQGRNLQSHHILQDQWAQQNVPGYSRGAAPAILLETGANPTRLPHTIVSNLQNARRDARVAAGQGRWSTTAREELTNSSNDLRTALQSTNLTAREADRIRKHALRRAYKHFDELGVDFSN
jgi:hypothetical protein